ncbi:MAG: hypothetical protein JWO82_1283, partial [Akkermansiaceae bacterium]|nr:hypothetical protein [Akkermansiaceae bacterium]
MTVYHLGRILVRCALIAVVAAGCFGIYLFKRTNSRAFQEGLDAKVGSALGAKEAKIQDFGRSGGEFKIRQLAAEGTAETFYNRLDASLIQFKTGLLGGVTGPWDAGTIRVDQLNMNLKAGADSAAEAEAIGKSFVKSYPDFTFSSLDVKDASLVWGFTAAERQNRGFSTQGRIDNSHLKAVRGNNGWHLEFEGGTFTQNWLEKADIQTLVMDCNADGIRVTEASLKLDQTATITISDLEITAGEKPQVSGRLKISHLDVRHIIPDAVREYMEGSISGEFKVSGSTNTAEGIVMEGEVKLDRDVICMRERLPLLKAMSVLDNYHTYRKVEFNDGGFRLKTSAQKINISAVDLKAGDLMMLKGGVVVRQPTPKELAESPAAPAGVGMGTDLGGDSPQEPAGGEKKKGDINLKEA